MVYDCAIIVMTVVRTNKKVKKYVIFNGHNLINVY